MTKIDAKGLAALLAKSQFEGDPGRPYDGQPWTFAGPRGSTKLPAHMTLRDLGDLVAETVREYMAGVDRFGGGVDADALTQNLLLKIENETRAATGAK